MQVANVESGETSSSAEEHRLQLSAPHQENWQRWKTYMPERQWGTVREDYSADGNTWESFTYDAARSRAYRWGEDGLLGWTDRECRLCYSTSLWNGQHPHLKERLFGLSNGEGNHGEDVKELYYYLDATPTGSYAKALNKYSQRCLRTAGETFPNHSRSCSHPGLPPAFCSHRFGSSHKPVCSRGGCVFHAADLRSRRVCKRVIPSQTSAEDRNIARQAYAGLLWSKQFYYYIVDRWFEGDAKQPAPPEAHRTFRNADWHQLSCRDVLSVPDKGEYPWLAAWDTAFHMIPMADLDPSL